MALYFPGVALVTGAASGRDYSTYAELGSDTADRYEQASDKGLLWLLPKMAA
jgi:hypothetical protein